MEDVDGEFGRVDVFWCRDFEDYVVLVNGAVESDR